MWNKQVSPYGGLFTMQFGNYLLIQGAVLIGLGILYFMSYSYNLDSYLFGNARMAIVIIALLELVEIGYVFWGLQKNDSEPPKHIYSEAANGEAFIQQKYSKKFIFQFTDDSILYTAKTNTAESTDEIEYSTISANIWEYIEKNEWFRNVGFIWLGIGVWFEVLPLTRGEGGLPFWSVLGVICLGIYFFHQIKFTVVEGSDKILVVQDEQHDKILEVIFSKRNEYVLDKYGEIDFDNHPDDEMSRFKAMKKEKVITDEEFTEIKGKIESFHKSKPIKSPLQP